MTDTQRIIKKYPNRRLYDTQASAYITLCDIKVYVLDRTPFRVVDAKTQQDLTRCILMQIILEEELGKSPLFSCDMLSQMIRSYGNGMQDILGNYLEQGLRSAIEWQQPNSMGPQSTTAPATAKLADLMGHYLTQITQLYQAMHTPAGLTPQANLFHDQPMRPVDRQYPTGNQPHLTEGGRNIHPTV